VNNVHKYNPEFHCVRGVPRRRKCGWYGERPKRLKLLYDFILRRLRKGWSVARIAEELATTRMQIQAWRDADPAFNVECLDAIEHGNDLMEDEARRRAVDGVTEPVFHQGKVCGEVTRYSDKLLQFMLTVRRYKNIGQYTPVSQATMPLDATPREVAELESKTDAELAALYSEALEKAAGDKRVS
jgi:hypothetical protein